MEWFSVNDSFGQMEADLYIILYTSYTKGGYRTTIHTYSVFVLLKQWLIT